MVTYIMAMATTIQISERLLKELKQKKLVEKESYEEVIWDLIEDTAELSEETKKHIMQSEKEIKQGRYKPLEKIEKELGL